MTTTRTPDSTSSSAETRSMSLWSMIAMSSAVKRLTRFFVRRSSFACPVSSMKLIRLTLDRNSRPPSIRCSSSRRCASSSEAMRVCVGSPGDLLHPEVPVRDARNLREVRDRHHLCALGQPAERLGDPVRRLAADAGVDLVEDHRLAARDGGDRQCDARELPARRGLGDRRERQSRVRPDEERHPRRRPSGRALALLARRRTRLRPSRPRRARRDRLGEARRGLPPRAAQLARRAARHCARRPRALPQRPRPGRSPRRSLRAPRAPRLRARAARRRSRRESAASRPRSARDPPRPVRAGRARPRASSGILEARSPSRAAAARRRAARRLRAQARAQAARAVRLRARPSRQGRLPPRPRRAQAPRPLPRPRQRAP